MLTNLNYRCKFNNNLINKKHLTHKIHKNKIFFNYFNIYTKTNSLSLNGILTLFPFLRKPNNHIPTEIKTSSPNFCLRMGDGV